ncbi:hypothetical protein LINPERHAP2_LOCUS332 [Linum perenne]
MRGRSSPPQAVTQEKEEAPMEIDSSSNKEPQVSGAYIRSLVKQLTSSSRTKDQHHHMNSTDSSSASSASSSSCASVGLSSQSSSIPKTENQPQPQPQPHKKQVRRRLHTSRPYQERLLNMAEARREIVTALKYHRAAMKQQQEAAANQHQQQQQDAEDVLGCKQDSLQHQLRPLIPSNFEPNLKSRRNPRTYPSTTTTNPFSYPLHHPAPCSNYYPLLPPGDSLNFPLPNQPLGLNLNLQDFNNIDTSTLYHNPTSSLSSSSSSSSSSSASSSYLYYSSSSPSSSYSSPSLSVSADQLPSKLLHHDDQQGVFPPSSGGGGFHHVLDADELAEIRSIGDQHQMEWNDTMNVVTSAWWFKFINTMELGPDHDHTSLSGDLFDDKMMDIPPWLNPNDVSLQHQHIINDYYPQSHDPCMEMEMEMEIGEIEATEGEWWA